MNEFHVDMNEYLPLRDVVFKTLRQAILTGELQPGDRLSGLRLRVDAVCIQNEDGGFFHSLPPGRLWFLSAAARWTLAVLPFGKKGKR